MEKTTYYVRKDWTIEDVRNMLGCANELDRLKRAIRFEDQIAHSRHLSDEIVNEVLNSGVYTISLLANPHLTSTQLLMFIHTITKQNCQKHKVLLAQLVRHEHAKDEVLLAILAKAMEFLNRKADYDFVDELCKEVLANENNTSQMKQIVDVFKKSRKN